MKLSLISPTSLIPSFGNMGDFHLTLAHLLEDEPNAYENAIVASQKPIYLDNGLFENGESVPVGTLMNHAARLKAQFVFAPDVLFNKEATEENLDNAWKQLQIAKEEYGSKTKLAAVVQADNHNDFIESYQNMCNDERIDLIGLSILSIPESFKGLTGTDDIAMNRMRCISIINELPKQKNSHLLGLGSSYVDVVYGSRYDWIVSHDSSSAIWNAIQGHEILDNFEVKGGKTRVHVDFDWNESLSDETVELIINNINKAKLACHN